MIDVPVTIASLSASGADKNLLPAVTRGLAEGSTAAKIMRAALTGDASALQSLLAKPEALPDFANEHGITPLMVAAARGHANIVEALTAHPLVNLSRSTPDGWTALHVASALNQSATAKVLLQHHASFNLATTSRQSAFDLAVGQPVEEIFWQDRNFARSRKRPMPLQTPQPASVPAPDDGLKKAFYDALLGIGLTGTRGEAGNILQNNYAMAMGALTLPQFKAAYEKIIALGHELDWRLVFFSAVKKGNTQVMCFLHDKRLFEMPVLSGALALSVDTGDDRNVVHHLLRWGASPHAKALSGGGAVYEAAFAKMRTGAFAEMAALSRDPLPKDELTQFHRLATRRSYMAAFRVIGRKGRLDRENVEKIRTDAEAAKHFAMIRALRAGLLRRDLKGVSSKTLNVHFNNAAAGSDILQAMAVYAEGRTDRFFRGMVSFSPEAGAKVLALALQQNEFTFARMMAGDGYALKNAPASVLEKLEKNGSEAARKFAADHLAGRHAYKPLENVGMLPSGGAYYPILMGRMGY